MRFWGHLKTVTKHRWLVMKGCFRVGLYWQGLTHDLSKFSPTEFRVGVRYYQGVRSPNAAEREDRGCSTAWMHHKGRNRHHFEYWTDLRPGSYEYVPIPMPPRYLAEMFIDRVSASKTYHGKDYADGDALAYFERAHESRMMHEETERKLRYLLKMLAARGEKETLAFMKVHVLRGEPFAEEGTE